jgi:hypothetical protein
VCGKNSYKSWSGHTQPFFSSLPISFNIMAPKVLDSSQWTPSDRLKPGNS